MSQTLSTCRPPVAILGVPFDRVTTVEAIQVIETMIASRLPHYLVTANVDFLVQARSDQELMRILCRAHLVLCDGTPLVWASRWLGNPLPERVAGSDLVPQLVRLAARKGLRLFFLGARPQAAQLAVANLRSQYPELIIAGHYSPPFAPLEKMDHDEIRRRIEAARPDMLFVCFGCPKQEKWIAAHYQSLGVPVVAGVGGTMDFLAGQLRRAPVWMRRCGAEWLFRLAQEPRRLLARYLRDLWVFGGCFVSQWWRLRAPASAGNDACQAVMLELPASGWPLAWQGEITAANAHQVWEQIRFYRSRLGAQRKWTLDLSRVRFIDSSGLGVLVWAKRLALHHGAQMALVGLQPAVRRIIRLARLECFLLEERGELKQDLESDSQWPWRAAA